MLILTVDWMFPPLPHTNPECNMTGDRKFAILFAATLLCARKLVDMVSDRPRPAKLYAVDRAVS